MTSSSSSSSSSSSTLLLPGQPLSFPTKAPLPQPGEGVYALGSTHLISSLVGYQSNSNSNPNSTSSTTPTKVSISNSSSRFTVPTSGSIIIGRITRVNTRQATVSILVVDGKPCKNSNNHTLNDGSRNGNENGFSFFPPSFGVGNHNHAAGEADSGDFTGVIRSQDIRATEKDKVITNESFRPGDIVKAQVISLGDSRSYYLSTSSNHLGVIYAVSSSSLYSLSNSISNEDTEDDEEGDGEPVALEPISWCEMRDPKTGAIEKRKVAKPDGSREKLPT